jgi:hypothetical protein
MDLARKREREKRLEVQQTKFYIPLAGFSRNDIIRSQLEENSIGEDIVRYKLQWTDRLLRMDSTSSPKIEYYYRSKEEKPQRR